MNILITGGAGFVGSTLCKYLLDKYPNYQVTILDNLSTGALTNLGSCHTNPRFQFYIGSITDSYMVELLLGQTDLVINLADSKSQEEAVYTNCIGTQVLLDLISSMDDIRLIQVSDYSVYGGYSVHPHIEENVLQPITPHAATKAAADQLVLGCSEANNINSTIVRLPTVYGPLQNPRSGVANIITSALSKEDIFVPNGNFEFIHVDNVCIALDKIIHSNKKTKVFNVGSGERCSMAEIAHMTKESLQQNNQVKVKRISKPIQYGISSERIILELGKYPVINIRDGITRTINWYAANKQWWKDSTSR